MEKQDGNRFKTSDAIALALRFGCPIYTYESIMVTAGILMEEDAENPRQDEPVEMKYSRKKLHLRNTPLTSLARCCRQQWKMRNMRRHRE